VIIKKAQDRIVIILPTLGIVIKFPIIHFIFFLKFLKDAYQIKHKIRKWDYWKVMWRLSAECDFAPKALLFKGLSVNWNEFWFYQTTHNPFLQPTYFSLFGLVNIQKYGEPCQFEGKSFWNQIYNLTKGAAMKDGHHFENPANFSLYNGKLRILDYGSSKTRLIVKKYGDKIVTDFDPNYT